MDHSSDSQAFIELIERNKGIIYKIARAYCPDHEEQKDLVQEMILQLWRSYKKFDERYKWTTWMYRVSLNVAISYAAVLKKKGSYTANFNDELMTVAVPEYTEESDERVEKLNHLISNLKEVERGIMILFLEGKSYKEISHILGISATNVSTKMMRIKKKLKDQFTVKES